MHCIVVLEHTYRGVRLSVCREPCYPVHCKPIVRPGVPRVKPKVDTSMQLFYNRSTFSGVYDSSLA
jgi:hypothetical protein